MCVICVKPAGKNLPTKQDLKRMFDMNHDGCGFVSATMNYHSMNFEDFYNHLIVVPKKEACIIHFRWATHGSIGLANCHPFHDEKTDVWFAHNGILSIKPQGDMTDSETAFRKTLVPIIKKKGFESKALAEASCHIIGGSKFAFMKDGRVRLFGHYEKYGDCLYSNLRFLPLPKAWIYA